MLASDVDKNSELLKPYEAVRTALAAASLSTLLDVDFPSPAGPDKPKPSVVAATPGDSRSSRNSRVAVAAKALRAVVTIRHSSASGSGFLITSSGLIVTNAHVVDGASRIAVRTADGEDYLASIVATDVSRDLALLKINGWRGDRLTLGDPAALEVGEDVVAIGTPMGLEGTVTRGIVSAKRRMGGVDVIQIDAAISPGSSGGPLLNESGDVVGVTSWKLTGAKTSAEALGFAVSTAELRRAFAQFLTP
jgi:S1-C subfamily serine protease